MKLKQKAMVGFNLFLMIACVLLGVVAYMNAAEGIDVALEMKADGDLSQLEALIDKEHRVLGRSRATRFTRAT